MLIRTFNATSTERLQQHLLFFTTGRTNCTFFLWKLHLAWLSHHGHSTILLRSESPSGKCAKLHTVVASNNGDHLTRSLYYCLLAPHMSIWVLFFTHIPFVVVATSPVVLCWLCDSPRMGCAWRTTPYIYVERTSNNRVIMACELYCCLLPQCEALRICRSGFSIATL